MRDFEYCGSSGNLLIYIPNYVILPSSSNAYNKNNYPNALKIDYFYGFSMY